LSDQNVRENFTHAESRGQLFHLISGTAMVVRPITAAKAGFGGVELRFLKAGTSDAFLGGFEIYRA